MASSDSRPEDLIVSSQNKPVAKHRPPVLYYTHNPSNPLELYSGQSLPDRETQILDELKEHTKHGPLKYYSYDIKMPLMLNPQESPLLCRETPEEFKPINAHFSAQIHALFNALKACEDSNSKGNEPEFHEDGLGLGISIGLQSYDVYPDCWHRLFHSRRLCLDDAAGLPVLSRVTKLQIDPDITYDLTFDRTRPVSLRVLPELLTRLPALEELDCKWLWERAPVAFESSELRRYSREWEGPWRDSRHEFGRAVDELHNQMPLSVRKARLRFWRPRYAFRDDQSIIMPNLVFPADEDPVSIGLRTLASHFEEFDLRAFLTPDFFKAPVQWSKMRRLRIEFHPCRPDGRWYFVGPRGEDSNPEGFEVTDEHYPPTGPNKDDTNLDEEWDENWDEGDVYLPDMFRTEPLAQRIEPLLEAFATAVKGIPVLEEAELFTHLSWNPSEDRLAEYGDETPYDAEYGGRRWGLRYVPGKNGAEGLVEWQVGAWRPRESVIKLFKELGGAVGIKMIWKAFEFMNWMGDIQT